MKTRNLILFIVAFASSCSAEEVPDAKSKEMQTKTKQLIQLVRQDKRGEAAKVILPPKESGVKRHAASFESVSKFFDGVDLEKIKFGPSSFDAERRVFVIRIVEPRNLQLEYAVDPETGNPGKLQAIHP